MSLADVIARRKGQPVTPVTPEVTPGVTPAALGREGRNPCNPCNPKKHRGAEAKPKRTNPDAVLLKVARQLQASLASLRAVMDDDDIEATATGEYTPAYLLEFFRLKQERGELLADQPQPLALAPVTRALDNRPGHAQRLKAWRPAHERFMDHLTACPECYAPRGRYCTTGAELRRVYLQTYARLISPDGMPLADGGEQPQPD